MDQKILDFLTTERVCSLTTCLNDGSPHAAAMHFSHSANPLELYFSTENTAKKCEALLASSSVKASVVLGFSEEQFVTLQLDGQVSIVKDPSEVGSIQTVHYAKHPHAAKYKDAPETVFLKFTPKWWRYSDYKTEPLTLISSES